MVAERLMDKIFRSIVLLRNEVEQQKEWISSYVLETDGRYRACSTDYPGVRETER